MGKDERITKLTYAVFIILILVGVVSIFIGRDIGSKTVSQILEFFGTTLVGVFTVSLIYERVIAKQHFEYFRRQLTSELEKMNSIQSECVELGIDEIFETRSAYLSEYPFMRIIEESPESGKIICVGMNLCRLFNMIAEFKRGLEKGMRFELACIHQDSMNDATKAVIPMRESDILPPLETLEKDILGWAKEEKPKGSLEFRRHSIPLFASALIFTSKDGKEKLVWDLSFGRDNNAKKVIILSTDRPLGKNLKDRYIKIYNSAVCKVEYSDGNVKPEDWTASQLT